jgi:hypothetical protein
LQRGLQRFAKPWYRARALRIFRDDASLSVTSSLWKEAERALDESEYYLLLCSPEAASSEWVAKEAGHWRETKPIEKVLVVLTGGQLIWDRRADDFDWRRTTAISPESGSTRSPTVIMPASMSYWERSADWKRSVEKEVMLNPRYCLSCTARRTIEPR